MSTYYPAYWGGHPLVEHAVRTLWKNPERDRQVVIQPARISPMDGSRNSIEGVWGAIPLPVQNKRFHVYQIGQVSMERLGLLNKPRVWMRCSEVMGKENLMVNLYTEKGIELPRFRAWFVMTHDQNVLVAVEDSPSITDLRIEPLFLRFYSNAGLPEQDPTGSGRPFEMIRSNGIVVSDPNEFVQLQREYQRMVNRIQTLEFDYQPRGHSGSFGTVNQRRVQNGAVLLFHNGIWKPNIALGDIKQGDIIEYVYDSSIRKCVYYHLSNARTFLSERDGIRKYLLAYAGRQYSSVPFYAGKDTDVFIDFHDDVDFYIAQATPDANDVTHGIYYHRNNAVAVRQVTHRDYSIPVSFVQGHLNNRVVGTQDISQCVVVAFIREVGEVDRTIPSSHRTPYRYIGHETNRLMELERLDYTGRLDAMIGVNALTGIWDAPTLENSKLMRFLDAPITDIQLKDVQDIYGYYGMVNVVYQLDALMENVVGSNHSSYRDKSLIRQTGYRFFGGGNVAEPEIVSGIVEGTQVTGSGSPGRHYPGAINKGEVHEFVGYRQWNLNPNYHYRFYRTRLKDALPDPTQWEDVTGQSSLYSVVNDRVVWHTNPETDYVLIRSDRDLYHDLVVYPLAADSNSTIDQPIQIPLNKKRRSVARKDGGTTAIETGGFHIPFGQLVVYLNGRFLTPKLDYVIKDQQVVILNREYLNTSVTNMTHFQGTNRYRMTLRPGNAVVEILGLGHPTTELTPWPLDDQGWTRYGQFSNNYRIDLAYRRQSAIYVDGILQEINHHSESPHAYPLMSLNGKPYVQVDTLVHIPGLVEQSAYTYWVNEKARDERIEQYLTDRITFTRETDEDVIDGLHTVYSPIMQAVLQRMRFDRDIPEYQAVLNDPSTQRVYEYFQSISQQWADIDPTLQQDPGSFYDPRYVKVVPHLYQHPVPVTAPEYAVIRRVNEVFLQDRLDLASWFIINNL